MNEMSKKVAAKNRCKNVQFVSHLLVGSGSGSTSSPVVDLEGEDGSKERMQEPAKRRKIEASSKGPVTPIRVVALRCEGGDLLQLPRVWPELDRCSSHLTLFLDDLELKVIHDLVPAGQSKAITEGVNAAMKALEVATTLNNASKEVRSGRMCW